VIASVLGGIGVFLIGVVLLSEGLKAAAGGALRSLLQRFARTPGRAVLSGAGVTALVQSSSATTLTTIGFVSAGLLTFPQAVGLIFGANLGTTSTGWLVSVLGFKVNLGAIALPAVGVGALLRLIGRGRWSHGGLALAGFGLIFVGIDILQDGMAGLAERVDPASLPGATLTGRIVLIGTGTVMTVVMQSSSAAVTTTLAALHAGGIAMDQAALLVIGQNLGTSITALLAAIGGSIPVRRTAVAHMLFNLITGAIALILFPLLLGGARWMAGAEDPALGIAIFHTGFNLMGVAVLFPVLGAFAGFVQRVVPEVRPSMIRNLDPSVAEVPQVAVEAGRQSAELVQGVLTRELARLLQAGVSIPRPRTTDPQGAGPASRVDDIAPALAGLRAFLTRIRTDPADRQHFSRHLSLVHASEHLDRLEELRREFDELGEVPESLGPAARELAEELHDIAGGDVEGMESLSRSLAEVRRRRREGILEEIARGELPPEVGRITILHLKRMDRIAYHAWRGAHHLAVAGGAQGSEEPPAGGIDSQEDPAGPASPEAAGAPGGQAP
jgi:phosphate:Na+ symporter